MDLFRFRLDIEYCGTPYLGWQSQAGGRTVQDATERALAKLKEAPRRLICAGRTDAGVHALGQVAQLLLMSDRQDIGISIDTGEQVDPAASGPALSEAVAADRSPRIFIYDNYPGGIGFSRPLFRMHAELLGHTRELIADCECDNGCPGCVGPVGHTGPMAKAAALRILSLLLEGPMALPA